jgi:hypothetical protein
MIHAKEKANPSFQGWRNSIPSFIQYLFYPQSLSSSSHLREYAFFVTQNVKPTMIKRAITPKMMAPTIV